MYSVTEALATGSPHHELRVFLKLLSCPSTHTRPGGAANKMAKLAQCVSYCMSKFHAVNVLGISSICLRVIFFRNDFHSDGCSLFARFFHCLRLDWNDRYSGGGCLWRGSSESGAHQVTAITLITDVEVPNFLCVLLQCHMKPSSLSCWTSFQGHNTYRGADGPYSSQPYVVTSTLSFS